VLALVWATVVLVVMVSVACHSLLLCLAWIWSGEESARRLGCLLFVSSTGGCHFGTLQQSVSLVLVGQPSQKCVCVCASACVRV
jgi:hypothetical protein